MNYFGCVVVFDHRFTEDVQSYVCVSHERSHVQLVPIDRPAGACYRTRTYNLETDGTIVCAFADSQVILDAIRRLGPLQIMESLHRTSMFDQHLRVTLTQLRLALLASAKVFPLDTLKPRDRTGREVEVVGETGLYDRFIVLSDDGLGAARVVRTKTTTGSVYEINKARWTILSDAPGLPSLERVIKELTGSHPELELTFTRWSTSAHFARTVT